MNPLGVHFIPTHTGRHHWQYIRDAQPDVLKIVGTGFPDVQQISDAYQVEPNARLVLRDHALSEQHADLWASPEATGTRHAREMAEHMTAAYAEAQRRRLPMPPPERVMLLGVNEPVIELFQRQEDGSNYDEWLAMVRTRSALLDGYMVAFGTEANEHWHPAGLGNFSSGQPANLKPGSYPTFDWFPRTRAFLEKPHGNALVCHEYWRAETGPEGWWDWHTCRFMHLEVACDVLVLECGVDQQITREDPHGNRGWLGHMTPAQYADQMGRYIRRCMTDSRFVAATPYTLDGTDDWESFYIEPAIPQFVALGAALRTEAASRPTNTIQLPIVVVDAPEPPDSTPPAPPAGVLDPNVLMAILDIESGAAFGPSGRLVVRFEAHVFKAQLGNDELFARHFAIADAQPWARPQYYRVQADGPWVEVHGAGQASEWAALETAMRLDRNAALRSISMGRPQIMGFNAARVGYASAAAMFDAFARREDGEAAQVIAFLNYLLTDAALVRAVKESDWRTIAAAYNGSGAVDVYAPRLEAAWRKRGGVGYAGR